MLFVFLLANCDLIKFFWDPTDLGFCLQKKELTMWSCLLFWAAWLHRCTNHFLSATYLSEYGDSESLNFLIWSTKVAIYTNRIERLCCQCREYLFPPVIVFLSFIFHYISRMLIQLLLLIIGRDSFFIVPITISCRLWHRRDNLAKCEGSSSIFTIKIVISFLFPFLSLFFLNKWKWWHLHHITRSCYHVPPNWFAPNSWIGTKDLDL